MLTSDMSSLLRSYRSSHNPNSSLTEERDCVTNHNDVRELITNISEVTSSVIKTDTCPYLFIFHW